MILNNKKVFKFCFDKKNRLLFSKTSSLLLVYEGNDDVSIKYSKDDDYCCMLEKHDRKTSISNTCNYDADISNCSTDINLSSSMQEDDDHQHKHQGYLNDIGIENEETNMDHCLYDDSDRLATSSGLNGSNSKSTMRSTKLPNVQQVSPPGSKRMFLETPQLRSTSPHSMDSWICYSNSSDEYTCSSQDCIISKKPMGKMTTTTLVSATGKTKSIKRGASDDACVVGEDSEDVDVYDKINFVTNLNSNNKNKISIKSNCSSSNKSSNKFNNACVTSLPTPKTSPSDKTGISNSNFFDEHATDKTKLSFKFHEKEPLEVGSSDKDDGIGDEEELPDDEDDDDLEEIEDDEQLSSLSSNIDTIIVSENGTAKYFKSSSSNDNNDLPNKKNRLTSCSASSVTSTATTTTTQVESKAITTTSPSKSTTNKENNNCGDVLKNGALGSVDVRIIDFAHTTFALKNGSIMGSGNSTLSSHNKNTTLSLSNSKVHYGPDNGFLVGLNSLKRILSEILSENYQEK